jgi:hypothetical protein
VIEPGSINLRQRLPGTAVPTWSRSGPPISMIRRTNTRRRLAFRNCVKRFYDPDIDRQNETMLFIGVTEGRAACFFGPTGPLYTGYLPIIRPLSWSFDEEALRATFLEKTKFLLLNAP